jgi:hypothetical protein
LDSVPSNRDEQRNEYVSAEDLAEACEILCPKPPDTVAAYPLRLRVEELISDSGRLVRRVDPDSSIGFLAIRIASHTEGLWLMLQLNAAELVGLGWDVDEGLDRVDRAWDELRRRLGLAGR